MDEWFVVKVINFDEKTKKFEVLDEEAGDDEEGGVQKTYKLSASCIIPFPERNDPSGVLKNSLRGEMFWLFIRKQLHFIKQLSLVHLERGNPMSIYWNSMTELCRKGRYRFTRWFHCQNGIGNEICV
ncbi:hypothetical protein E1A91_D07G261700v1 [Gossypium mustelinum]|uniref:SGF29 C-terminal domain-containing protein n=1 Tax=Gossypium mustelinum TaxID=34275 RepID=A0A5D2UF93_GOSMU|nr:hypothetical protein E1A91_D07G261700v1 [Gossypium mustelinum]